MPLSSNVRWWAKAGVARAPADAAFWPVADIGVVCRLNHDYDAQARVPINVLGRSFRSWAARDEDGIDGLQNYFVLLIAQVDLAADNTPVRFRLRLALLQDGQFEIKLVSRTHRDREPEFIPAEPGKGP